MLQRYRERYIKNAKVSKVVPLFLQKDKIPVVSCKLKFILLA